MGSITGLGFEFAFVEDDGREGANDGGVYLGLHWSMKAPPSANRRIKAPPNAGSFF